MNRAAYVKHLEHDLDASSKTINDLTQENHELRETLHLMNLKLYEFSSDLSLHQTTLHHR